VRFIRPVHAGAQRCPVLLHHEAGLGLEMTLEGPEQERAGSWDNRTAQSSRRPAPKNEPLKLSGPTLGTWRRPGPTVTVLRKRSQGENWSRPANLPTNKWQFMKSQPRRRAPPCPSNCFSPFQSHTLPTRCRWVSFSFPQVTMTKHLQCWCRSRIACCPGTWETWEIFTKVLQAVSGTGLSRDYFDQ